MVGSTPTLSQSINLGVQFNNSGGSNRHTPDYSWCDGTALNHHIPSGDEIQQLNAPVRGYRNSNYICRNSPDINFN